MTYQCPDDSMRYGDAQNMMAHGRTHQPARFSALLNPTGRTVDTGKWKACPLSFQVQVVCDLLISVLTSSVGLSKCFS